MTVADKRGVANLVEDHWRRVSLGLASYQDVARELGVTRQTVFKAFAARGWTREAWAKRQQAEEAERQQQASARRNSPGDADEDQGLLPEAQRDQLLRQVGLGIVKAGTTLVAELNAGIDRERGKMTPTVINGYLRALERLNGALIPWLMPPPPEAKSGPLEQLVVTVMSDEEVTEMKARRMDFGEDDDAGATPVSTAAPVPVATVCPSPATSQSPESPLVTIHDGLPDQSQFREWLGQMSERRGRRHLRNIAGALGLQVAVGQDSQHVIDLILHETRGDPERLRLVARIVE